MRALIHLLGPFLVLSLGACAGMQGTGEPGAPAGTCPAKAHQDWVGNRIDYLNDIDLPEGTRVLFPTTPASDDVNPARLNVKVGKGDVIEGVYCG